MAKKKVRNRIKKDNILIAILTIILVVLILTLVILGKNILKKNNGSVSEVEILDRIDSYGYYLSDNNTEYYKKLFNELKSLLNSDNIDEEKYASLVAQLFTADFYDLDSKYSKNDVGGSQFIYGDYKDTFIKKASSAEGIYYYVKSDLYGKRKQTLPVVKSVDIVSLKNTSYNYDKIKDTNAYEINVNVNYEKDLEYPKTVKLILVHNDKRIDIVEVK